MRLRNVLDGIPLKKFSGNKAEEIQGIVYSSKSVKPGDMFAALKGVKKDGFEFVGEALDNGAAVILSDQPKPKNLAKAWVQVSDTREALALCSANFYSHPSQKMKVVGITGTKGKTTITYLLEEILKKTQFVPGIIGTISYKGPGMNMTARLTTPEAPDLQRLLSEML
ncbi:MAG: Mur ligase family protein, partial [Candidatus Aminicenantes bacterium]|nr:Mur ligase family protein [Candidatus Aminicenantes bacterium]